MDFNRVSITLKRVGDDHIGQTYSILCAIPFLARGTGSSLAKLDPYHISYGKGLAPQEQYGRRYSQWD